MGKVYLVGAGPGDPELITKKGYEIIKKADVIVYDRLANEGLLRHRKKDSKLIYVGKLPNRHIVKQSRINEILIEESHNSNVVLRLKGGDPYVFGRGAEEAEALFDSGVDFEVVPGISSSIGGLCYAGIPVTHRDFSPSFHVVTGHRRHDDEIDICWDALSKETGTLIFLMGVTNAKNIANNLIEAGRDKSTPVAFISWASTPMQKKYITTLDSVEECIEKNNIKPPSLFVVGDVVKVSEKLSFFERKPLFSRKIAITRTRSQSSELRKKLEELGAYVVEIPTIKIEKKNGADTELIKMLEKKYDYIALTSKNSSSNFFEILKDKKYDTRKLANTKISSIGKSADDYLESIGIFSDIVSKEPTAKSLGKKLADSIAEGIICNAGVDSLDRVSEANIGVSENLEKISDDGESISKKKHTSKEVSILYPCSEIATDDFKNYIFDGIKDILKKEMSGEVEFRVCDKKLSINIKNLNVDIVFDRLDIYTNEVNFDEKERILEVLDGGVDAITFTSSSTFRNMCEILGEGKIDVLRKTNLVSIGENTSKEIKSKGFEPIESEIPSIDSMVEKIINTI